VDFVHGALRAGIAFRALTVVDRRSRWSPILKVAQRLFGQQVATALDRAIARRGTPRTIIVDNGTKFMSRALDEWAYRRGVTLNFIRPGNATDSGFIEASNGTLREECLNGN
jgi:putative transposase